MPNLNLRLELVCSAHAPDCLPVPLHHVDVNVFSTACVCLPACKPDVAVLGDVSFSYEVDFNLGVRVCLGMFVLSVHKLTAHLTLFGGHMWFIDARSILGLDLTLVPTTLRTVTALVLRARLAKAAGSFV